jgi:cytochrome c oxidase subunit 1
MFATGLPQTSESFFTAATLMIVIPTGTQFFCWIATIWNGRLQFQIPMLWVSGFVATFLVGGLSGPILASVPVDTQVHDTYFVVAHFHYVIIGGSIFTMFAGLYHWIPKMGGFLMNETLGKIHFWLFFAGFNMTFFPMHILGLRGMPRRIYTYPPEMHWNALNLLASIGAIFMAAGVLVFVWNFLQSRWSGERAGDNPWGAGGLEWATTSPPPEYNFLELPTVNGREALWDAAPNQPIVVGLRSDIQELLVTHSLDAEPQLKEKSEGHSIWPFLAAIAVSLTFVGSIFNAWAVPLGAIPVIATLVGWLWPRGSSPPTPEVVGKEA